jgi:hypothetical protein
MSNPENNWVHISLKAANGALIDVRAEDGDTLRALVDGATEHGVYDRAVAGFAADAAEAGVEAAKKGFGKTTEQKSSGGFGNKGKQSGGSAELDKYLGDHDGYKVTVKSGKFGPYFNAYNSTSKDRINVNVPKGMDPEQATLQDAIDTISAA